MAFRNNANRPSQVETYAALEQALTRAFARIEQTPWDQWDRVGADLQADATLHGAGSRPTVVDFTGGEEADGSRELIARAFTPFRFWPLGGLAVYEGCHFTQGAAPTMFTQDELMQVW